jgi:hypothetical protein
MQTYTIRLRTIEERMNSAASRDDLRRRLEILLEHTLVLPLLCRRLVSTVSELGRSVDPFELDLLQCSPASVGEHALAEGNNPLLDTRASSLQKKEVILDLTVADEAAKTMVVLATFVIILGKNSRSNLLLRYIELG